VVPQQWHVYIVDLQPRIGAKPGKQRPCVAIQPTLFAESGLTSTVILPVSTRLIDDAFPLRVRLRKGICGLRSDSDVLVDQILAWDNGLFRQDLGELPDSVQDDIRAAVREFLDL
jgi:mRNA interferase MazF